MKEYEITIRETLEKTVVIEAESKGDALYFAERRWKDGDFILDADDFVDVEFEAKSPERNRDEGR